MPRVMWPGWTTRFVKTTSFDERRVFPKGSHLLFEPEDVAVDIVFIHDLPNNRDETWKSTNTNGPWPEQLLPYYVAKARIVTFGYDAGRVKKLGDMFDSNYLDQCAAELLKDYPLRLPSKSSFGALPENIQENQPGGIDIPVHIERPAVFIAHGFGGLVYEQALTRLYGSKTKGKMRRHAAILFDTPHHGAGLAEWAVMCAQRLRIPCADTAQKQDWSCFKNELAKIDDMQRLFRRIIRTEVKVNIAACYTTRFVPNSKLKLSAEWVVLPDFKPIGISKSHFEMTKLSEKDIAFGEIVELLKEWVQELSQESIDKEPLSLRDPLHEMRDILEYVHLPPNPWANCVQLESIEDAGSGIYVPGNIITYHNGHWGLVVSAERIRDNLHKHRPTDAQTTAFRSYDELISRGQHDDDFILWIRFTESLRRTQFQAETWPSGATGQPSSEVPKFSNIQTVELHPNKDYLIAASAVTKLENSAPALLVIGTKTVYGHTIQSTEFAHRHSPQQISTGLFLPSKIPKGLVIACIIREISQELAALRESPRTYEVPVIGRGS